MFPSFLHYATRPGGADPGLRRTVSALRLLLGGAEPLHPHPDPDGFSQLRHRAAEAPLTIRLARTRDAAIDRLSALDGVEAADGPRLVAELDGRPVAALELRTGAAVADPFVRTAPLVELLRVRAAQIGGLR